MNAYKRKKNCTGNIQGKPPGGKVPPQEKQQEKQNRKIKKADSVYRKPAPHSY